MSQNRTQNSGVASEADVHPCLKCSDYQIEASMKPKLQHSSWDPLHQRCIRLAFCQFRPGLSSNNPCGQQSEDLSEKCSGISLGTRNSRVFGSVRFCAELAGISSLSDEAHVKCGKLRRTTWETCQSQVFELAEHGDPSRVPWEMASAAWQDRSRQRLVDRWC